MELTRGTKIRFKDRFTGRTLEGIYRKEYRGNLIVLVATKAARGGNWVGTERVIKPEEIIAS